MIERMAELKNLNDLNTSPLLQAALEFFIKSGMYEKHIKKVRKSYEAKLRKAKEIFMSLKVKDLIWNVPDNGIFIWIQLSQHINVITLSEKLKNQGILIKSAEEFFLKREDEKKCDSRKLNYIRLCISGVSDENISTLNIIISIIRSYGNLD